MIRGQLMVRALEYLRGHYRERVSLEDVAEYVCVSKYHFSRRFHASVGITFQEYVTRLRMSRAKELLKNAPHLSITAIAHESGFGSLRNLEKHFKEREYKSPSEYRAASR